MPFKKVKVGSNMYQGWISHTASLLGGKCFHECAYCYVQSIIKRYPVFSERYTGNIKLIEKELDVKYGENKTIFIEHMNDLFAGNVPQEIIERILKHCNDFPNNTYVFQTKNPERFLQIKRELFPPKCIFGTTIETNRKMLDISKAPDPELRMLAMEKLKERKFLTCEPILDFDVDVLAEWISRIKPEFLNLGADSKGHNLPEPTVEKIHQLVAKLKEYGIELKEKHNLQRLMEK